MSGTDQFGKAVVEAEDEGDAFGVVDGVVTGGTDTDDFGPGREEGGGGATSGGEPDGVTEPGSAQSEEHPPSVVVDESGQVVGTAVWDPTLGAYVSDVVDTTVVEEHPDEAEVETTGAFPLPPDPDESFTGPGFPDTPEADVTLFKYFYTVDSGLVTRCTGIGIGVQTLFGPRQVQFALRFQAQRRTPQGAPVSPDALQEKTRQIVSGQLDKYWEELPIILSLPPYSIANLSDIANDLLTDVVKGLFIRSLQNELDSIDEGERVTVLRC